MSISKQTMNDDKQNNPSMIIFMKLKWMSLLDVYSFFFGRRMFNFFSYVVFPNNFLMAYFQNDRYFKWFFFFHLKNPEFLFQPPLFLTHPSNFQFCLNLDYIIFFFLKKKTSNYTICWPKLLKTTQNSNYHMLCHSWSEFGLFHGISISTKKKMLVHIGSSICFIL